MVFSWFLGLFCVVDLSINPFCPFNPYRKLFRFGIEWRIGEEEGGLAVHELREILQFPACLIVSGVFLSFQPYFVESYCHSSD